MPPPITIIKGPNGRPQVVTGPTPDDVYDLDSVGDGRVNGSMSEDDPRIEGDIYDDMPDWE